MQMLFRGVILLLWWASASRSHDPHVQDAAFPGSTSGSTQSKVTSATSTTSSSAATCPSRTVNYITHTLPQQCLRTDRASSSSSQSVNTNSSRESISRSRTSASAAPTASTNADSSLPPGKAAISSQEDVRERSAGSTPPPSVIIPPEKLSSSAHPASESDTDSPLDNVNFLSFEEWKRQNLAKAGQSLETVGRPPPNNQGRERPGAYNALDTFGDENEISLDFAGFGPGLHQPGSAAAQSASSTSTDLSPVDQPTPGSLELRSKDAGKTCKERTNYASFDCAANVLKANRECKSASSVLVENKDSYMLNICSAKNKYFIVELCDDILIDTVVLANYEFFSSSLRHFRVSVSDRYPVKEEKWRELGTYEARNTREVQAFLVENPLIWARYLRIEFLTHYGNEYYCPVSLLRVHGTTMIQEYLHHEEISREDNAEEASNLVGEVPAAPPIASSVADAIIIPPEAPSSVVEDGKGGSKHSSSRISQDTSPAQERHESLLAKGDDSTQSQFASENSGNKSSRSVSNQSTTTSSNASVRATSSMAKSHARDEQSASSASLPASHPVNISYERSSETFSTTVVTAAANSSSQHPTASGFSTSAHTSSRLSDSSINGVDIVTNETSPSAAAESTPSPQVVAHQVPSSTDTIRPVASSTSSQPAQPSTQESFFKSVHKRLQQLESNSTLSLQYIEEQSRILRDAFSKVEKRQLSATTTFLSNLNLTVMTDLQGFRQAYDQLWQSTVIELEGQREQFQREMLAMSSRLSLVADELVWQKRMGIVQSTLVLMCLALVLFGRSGQGPLEFPIMQQMMMKSTAALRAGWESPPNSPSPNSRSPARPFRPKLWRSNTGQSHLTDSDLSRPQSVDGPSVLVDPPTPSSPDTRSDADEHEEAPVPAGPVPSTSVSAAKKRRKRRQSNGNKGRSPLGYS